MSLRNPPWPSEEWSGSYRRNTPSTHQPLAWRAMSMFHSSESQSGSAARQACRQTTDYGGIWDRSRLASAMAITIGDDRGHDHDTLQDVLDVGVKADEREPAGHDAKDDGADDGAGDAPDASREAGSTDHRGGNRVELVRQPHPGLAARCTRRGDDAAETRQQSGNSVDEHQMPVHADAGYTRGLRVGAEGIGVLSVSRMTEQHVKDDRRHEEDKDGHGAFSDTRVALRQQAHRLASGVVPRETACAHHHSERGDERRDSGVRDEAAIDEARQRTGHQAGGDRNEDRQLGQRWEHRA